MSGIPKKGQLAVWHYPELTYRGQTVDPGQIIRLVGDEDDEPLVRLDYCTPIEKKTKTFECGACGQPFISERKRREHGDRRHADRFAKPMTVAEREAAEEEAKDRVNEAIQEHPIRWDRTKAALEAAA